MSEQLLLRSNKARVRCCFSGLCSPWTCFLGTMFNRPPAYELFIFSVDTRTLYSHSCVQVKAGC